ncbi:MAG: RNA polymerase subunit sigma [Anaerolineae bacterium]|nr:RNA polymerase subunit sigma [Anaerolineae bacterium]
MDQQLLEMAARRLRNARRAIAFTGAGISVESGIPPFRGPGGLWSKYDPSCLDLEYFLRYPREAWMVIKEIFYDYFGTAQPNAAHQVLAAWETGGWLPGGVITQNIDHLHQAAGSQRVIEFHGNNQQLVCLGCGSREPASPEVLAAIPPRCNQCSKVLKPDFVFYGEGIPYEAYEAAYGETQHSDVWLVVGTTGEVHPACSMPVEAKRNGAIIIEINVRPSEFTDTITDIFLRGTASEVLCRLQRMLPDG